MVPQVLPHVRGTGTAGQSVIYKRTHYEQHSSRREYIYDSADDRNDNQINEKFVKILVLKRIIIHKNLCHAFKTFIFSK